MTPVDRLTILPTWLLSEAANRAHRILHEHLARANVSGYEYRVLAAVGELGRLSQTELGRAAALDRRDTSHTVRQLEARRFVSRQVDPRDARRTLVELTDSGKRSLQGLDAVVQKAQREFCEPLTDAERRLLVDLLRRLS